MKKENVTWMRIKGTVKSIGGLTTPRLNARVFWGYGHHWFAKKYAIRKHKAEHDKANYVLPFGAEAVIVVNRLELIEMKKRGMIKKSLNIKVILEQAYFRATLTSLKTK
jgi:hypothetical protein